MSGSAEQAGKYFGVEPAEASYPSAVGIMAAGVCVAYPRSASDLPSGSFVWVPLANVYGRRPVLILTSLITCAFTAWGGTVGRDQIDQLFVGRAISGFSAAAAPALCIAVVCDLFCVRRLFLKPV